MKPAVNQSNTYLLIILIACVLAFAALSLVRSTATGAPFLSTRDSSSTPVPTVTNYDGSTRKLPDLTAMLSAERLLLSVGEKTVVYQTTRNEGAVDSKSSSTSVSADGYGTFYYLNEPISPGNAASNSFTFTCQSKGEKKITATADYNLRVSESNEQNNGYTLSIECA